MVATLREKGGFEHDFSALPFLFNAENDSVEKQQDMKTRRRTQRAQPTSVVNKWGQRVSKEDSLAFYCEKKALAALWECDASEPAIEVNFKMCNDCHTAFKVASRLWVGRSIRVNDGSRHHVFCNGVCSCNDTWR